MFSYHFRQLSLFARLPYYPGLQVVWYVRGEISRKVLQRGRTGPVYALNRIHRNYRLKPATWNSDDFLKWDRRQMPSSAFDEVFLVAKGAEDIFNMEKQVFSNTLRHFCVELWDYNSGTRMPLIWLQFNR